MGGVLVYLMCIFRSSRPILFWPKLCNLHQEKSLKIWYSKYKEMRKYVRMESSHTKSDLLD